MSLPPQQIRVKRKRVEDAVAFLQFDLGFKRLLSGGANSSWAYQRKVPPAPAATKGSNGSLPPPSISSTWHVTLPIIQASRPGDELRTRQSPERGPATATATSTTRAPPTPLSPLSPAPISAERGSRPDTPTGADVVVLEGEHEQQRLANRERRRFHIARSSLSPPPASSFPHHLRSASVGISKKERYGPSPVFVEKRKKKVPKGKLEKLSARASAASGTQELSKTAGPEKDAAGADADVEMRDGQDGRPAAPPQRALKRPNSRRAQSVSRPPSAPVVDPSTQDMSEMAATMNEWVLRTIEAGLDGPGGGGGGGVGPSLPLPKQTPRFRPKPPAKRFAERHPDRARALVAKDVDTDRGELVAGSSDEYESDEDPDGDFVYDTYERIPVEKLAAVANDQEIGVLVVENDDDMDAFFGPLANSDDEEDEEDENAENHYTADYPEDELDSEDEQDHGAYKFRTGNASDDEEFDRALCEDDSDDVEIEGVGDGNGDENEYIVEGENAASAMSKIRKYNRRMGL